LPPGEEKKNIHISPTKASKKMFFSKSPRFHGYLDFQKRQCASGKMRILMRQKISKQTVLLKNFIKYQSNILKIKKSVIFHNCVPVQLGI
jgi:hypothetical protein